MDSRNMIISPETSYTDAQYRANGCDLRNIKQMLLSGNKEQITFAVGRVLSQINDNKCAIEMITSDISEFLCDAMLPFDPYVSGTIYTCLGVMTRYKYFFTHNHSSFAMETVIRALHFIIKSGGHEVTVSQPLRVIVLIVQGYAKFDVMPEKKPFENLMNLLLTLLKRKPVSEEVKHQGGLIIKFLFEIELWKLNCGQNLIEICGKWFDLICSKDETFQSIPEKMMNLGCSLSEQTLRYLTKDYLINNHPLRDNEISCESGVINIIINFLVDNVAPEIRSMIPSSKKQNLEIITNFFTSLMYIFNELFPQRSQIAQRISEIGFIHLIKDVLSNEYLQGCEKLGKICVTVLTEILLSLSGDLFHFPDMWPTGRDHFLRELSVGMSLLPLDSSQWIQKLSDAEVNRSSRLALIIYFYFYSLTSNSTSSTELIYPSVIKLLNLSIGMNSAPLVIKAVWFILVMSQISKNCLSPASNGWATKKMLDILESQKEFSLIYTHHPALLFWTFSSSRISCRIQCEVVSLWLENRSSDCMVLDNLMTKSADVRLAIFQLLQDGFHHHVAHLVFSCLKNFMLQSDDDALSSNIWFLLPQILAKYTTDTSTAMHVDYIVELATLKVPAQPDISKIVRIASLLPEVLQKSDMISSSSVLALALQLLQTSLIHEDNRVLFAFLRCDHFTQRIVNGIKTDFAEVSLTSLKIVGILWNVNFQSDRLPVYFKKIILDGNDLLTILDGNDVELIKTELILIQQMLLSQFQSVLLNVKGISTEFRMQLFFGLEKVLFKYLPTISSQAWKCLQHCMTQEKSLIGDCLLHELVKYGLQYLKDSPEMVDFLMVWMDGQMEAEKFYDGSRRIKQTYFLETIEGISFFLAENIIQEWNCIGQKVLKCCKHFSIDTSCEPYSRIMNRIGFP